MLEISATNKAWFALMRSYFLGAIAPDVLKVEAEKIGGSPEDAAFRQEHFEALLGEVLIAEHEVGETKKHVLPYPSRRRFVHLAEELKLFKVPIWFEKTFETWCEFYPKTVGSKLERRMLDIRSLEEHGFVDLGFDCLFSRTVQPYIRVNADRSPHKPVETLASAVIAIPKVSESDLFEVLPFQYALATEGIAYTLDGMPATLTTLFKDFWGCPATHVLVCTAYKNTINLTKSVSSRVLAKNLVRDLAIQGVIVTG